MESFGALKLARWRQFEEVDLDLSSHLTVLTGPNGCGKTTVLNVLGRHFGWSLNFLTASFLSKKERKARYSDAWEAFEDESPRTNVVGSIEYASGLASRLTTSPHDQSQYQLNHENQQAVVGLHIPSHRPPPSYHRIQNIPIDPKIDTAALSGIPELSVRDVR